VAWRGSAPVQGSGTPTGRPVGTRRCVVRRPCVLWSWASMLCLARVGMLGSCGAQKHSQGYLERESVVCLLDSLNTSC
jgi:hypothetical protein